MNLHAIHHAAHARLNRCKASKKPISNEQWQAEAFRFITSRDGVTHGQIRALFADLSALALSDWLKEQRDSGVLKRVRINSLWKWSRA